MASNRSTAVNIHYAVVEVISFVKLIQYGLRQNLWNKVRTEMQAYLVNRSVFRRTRSSIRLANFFAKVWYQMMSRDLIYEAHWRVWFIVSAGNAVCCNLPPSMESSSSTWHSFVKHNSQPNYRAVGNFVWSSDMLGVSKLSINYHSYQRFLQTIRTPYKFTYGKRGFSPSGNGDDADPLAARTKRAGTGHESGFPLPGWARCAPAWERARPRPAWALSSA